MNRRWEKDGGGGGGTVGGRLVERGEGVGFGGQDYAQWLRYFLAQLIYLSKNEDFVTYSVSKTLREYGKVTTKALQHIRLIYTFCSFVHSLYKFVLQNEMPFTRTKPAFAF
jgi:hypothetical protein